MITSARCRHIESIPYPGAHQASWTPLRHRTRPGGTRWSVAVGCVLGSTAARTTLQLSRRSPGWCGAAARIRQPPAVQVGAVTLPGSRERVNVLGEPDTSHSSLNRRLISSASPVRRESRRALPFHRVPTGSRLGRRRRAGISASSPDDRSPFFVSGTPPARQGRRPVRAARPVRTGQLSSHSPRHCRSSVSPRDSRPRRQPVSVRRAGRQHRRHT